MLKYSFFLSGFVILLGCSKTTTQENLIGLWSLEEVKIDKYQEQPKSLFLQLSKDGTFAVAKASGDINGLYRASNSKLTLTAAQEEVYNQRWDVFCHEDFLMLKGQSSYSDFASHKRYRDYGPLSTELKFKRIEKVPNYQEIAEQVAGSWDLYKIRTEDDIQKLSGTTFEIDNQGNYAMSGEDGLNERGVATINARYRKLYFEDEELAWNIRFIGKELRLSQPELNLEYSLRKVGN